MSDSYSSTSKLAPVRRVETKDVPALKAIIDATGLFPSEMLDGMLAGFFEGTAARELWLTIDDDEPKAVAYCAPERMAQGTWNVLLIAVHPNHQRRGLGAALMNAIELDLMKRGERVMLVETSGLPDFEPTRAFYDKLGYDREARIRDFYSAGEDKIVFRKAL